MKIARAKREKPIARSRTRNRVRCKKGRSSSDSDDSPFGTRVGSETRVRLGDGGGEWEEEE